MTNPSTTTTTTATKVITAATTTRKKRRLRRKSIRRITEDLPVEIQTKILSRLPIESASICRKVCKSWKNLISQPSFVQLYYPSVSPVPTMTFLHSSDEPLRCRLTIVTGNKEDKTSTTGYNLSFSDKVIKIPLSGLHIVGSCNGLICLTCEDTSYNECYKLVLYNPVSDSYFMLSDPPICEWSEFEEKFGFGYVPSTGKYKAVKINYMRKLGMLLFHVCTITMGMRPTASSWRAIYDYEGEGRPKTRDGPPLRLPLYSYPVFFKGSIIWLLTGDIKWPDRPSLVYFDVEKEEIHTLQLPSTVFNDYYEMEQREGFMSAVGIGVYYDDNGNDHLYLCENLEHCAKIWEMEDYKCIDSLKLKWVIPVQYSKRMKLFKVQNDGKLLIRLQKKAMACYDTNTGILGTIKQF